MLKNLYDFCVLTDKYRSYLEGKFDFTPEGFPVFKKEMFLESEPEMIIPYYNRNNKIVKNPKETVICFFGADKCLYRRLENVFEEIEEYKRFKGVVGLDITVTADMDKEWQNLIMLVNQMFLAILAHHGIKIVMNTRIGSMDTLKNMNGLPKNVLCCTGFLGCKNLSTDADFSFLSKILFIRPSKLLIYGKHDMLVEKQLTKMGVKHLTYTDIHRLSKEVA